LTAAAAKLNEPAASSATAGELSVGIGAAATIEGCPQVSPGIPMEHETAVAPNPAGRYSACVRRLVFQRWAMTLLLLSRLVLGEFAHAVPVSHAPAEPEVVAAGSQNADCPQHEAAGGAGSESSDIESSADPHHDCCKSGACQCPCMHAPAALVASFVATSVHVDHGRIMTRANGFACDRLWLLFRPPA
jgi:hypothetical protein